jgi:prevent-host-death family protein
VRQIGVRELKTRASEILRNVRRRKTRYVITYRGQPVGMLTPIEEPKSAATVTAQENWDELIRLGEKIAEHWPAGVTSADILSEMRR